VRSPLSSGTGPWLASLLALGSLPGGHALAREPATPAITARAPQHAGEHDPTVGVIASLDRAFEAQQLGPRHLARLTSRQGQLTHPMAPGEGLVDIAAHLLYRDLARGLADPRVDVGRVVRWADAKRAGVAQQTHRRAHAEQQTDFSVPRWVPIAVTEPGARIDLPKGVHISVIGELRAPDSSFEMLDTPLTWGQYARVMGEIPAIASRRRDPHPASVFEPNKPATLLSRNQMEALIAELNAKHDGWVYDLPTVDEFVYVASERGRRDLRGLDYRAHGWFHEESGDETQRVAAKRPLLFDGRPLYDLFGNVQEALRFPDDYDPAGRYASGRITFNSHSARTLTPDPQPRAGGPPFSFAYPGGAAADPNDPGWDPGQNGMRLVRRRAAP
jgi:hypothetical protein